MKNLLITVALLLLSTLAFADNEFSGPYIGIQAGWVNGRDGGSEFTPPNPTPNGENLISKPSGALYGLTAGYNWLFDNDVLLGIELGVEKRNANDSRAAYADGIPVPNYPYRTELETSVSVMPKLGHLIANGTTLLFVTAGYELADIKRTYTNNDWNHGAFDSASNWQGGWAGGLGVERVIKENLTAKIEYRYADLGKHNFPVGALDSDPVGHWVEKQSYIENSIRVGLMYHF